MTRVPDYALRQNNLRRAMEEQGLYAIALNPGSSLLYLTGLHFHLMERPTVVVFPRDTDPVIILPVLELAKVQSLPYPISPYSFNDDPDTWMDVFQQATQLARLEGQRIGVEPTRWRFLEMSYLQTAVPSAHFISGAATLDQLRVCKDEQELAAMRKAVQIAEQALMDTMPSIKPGVSEMQIASELTAQLLKAGSDSELPFSPIVASGENSANPHATPSERRLQTGDLLIVDWGAACNGYISDLTRTFAIGEVEDEFQHIAEIVLAANFAGRCAAAPGIAASDVDRATRQVIESAGYGEFFTHRTGHGIGMEAHEPPYIRAGNELRLVPGMTFTVEPGIYLPGRGGVRIEDNVVITENGCETLSSMARELIAL